MPPVASGRGRNDVALRCGDAVESVVGFFVKQRESFGGADAGEDELVDMAGLQPIHRDMDRLPIGGDFG
jgi:hypothetical protein